MQLDPTFDEFAYSRRERRTITRDGRLEPKALARGHDGNAVAADIAAQDDRVARADLLRRDRRQASRESTPTPDVLT